MFHFCKIPHTLLAEACYDLVCRFFVSPVIYPPHIISLGLRYFVWVRDSVSGAPSADRMSSSPPFISTEESVMSRARSGALRARILDITDSFGYSHSGDGPWSADTANRIDSEPRQRHSLLFFISYPHKTAKSHIIMCITEINSLIEPSI